MADLLRGTRVHVQGRVSKPDDDTSHQRSSQKGLTYPSFSGVLLDNAFSSEGWDGVDVHADNVDTCGEVAGKIISIYCFSIER
jgi:hypothetical protein